MAGSLVSPPSADVVVAGQPGNLSYQEQMANSVASLVAAVSALPDLLWGSATLVGGQAVVPCSPIGPGSLVYLSRMGAAGTLGHLSVTIVNGTSFTIVSSSSGDASSVAYLIIP